MSYPHEAGSHSPLSGGRQSWALRGTTFGPVPSRRLGRSLGINNVPSKVCSYSCAYCQLGRMVQMTCEAQSFQSAAVVANAVRERVDEVRRAGEAIDYLTFVPDGEPAADRTLGPIIRLLRPIGIPVAVITNGSLLFLPEVRRALAEADFVSLKVDTVREETWRRLDRPHRRLELKAVLEGMRLFAATYTGTLTTETMLVAGVNDTDEELDDTARFVAGLHPTTAYLAIPTRPAAEEWVVAPSTQTLERAREIFRARFPRVDLLHDNDEAPASSEDAVADLLSITAVHPLREVAARRLLESKGASWQVVSELVQAGRLLEVPYGPNRYFARPVRRQSSRAEPGT